MAEGRSGDRPITGTFTPGELAITCEREPDSGILWMACIKEFSQCALGKTPKEATENLIGALAKDNIGGAFQVFERNCESLEKTGSVRRPIKGQSETSAMTDEGQSGVSE